VAGCFSPAVGWSLGQGDHCLAGGGFGGPVGVALGDEDVRVVHEPVDRRGGEVLGMISSNPDGCRFELTARVRRS